MNLSKLTPYAPRSTRFIGILAHGDWKIKCYGISCKAENVSDTHIAFAKENLEKWLSQSKITRLATYNLATLILHEGREGIFYIINWWIDENMLQQFVYLANYNSPSELQLVSDKGIITCVWEMEILWFERNAWVEQVLMQPENPAAYDNYLNELMPNTFATGK